MPFPRSRKIHNEASLYEYAVAALGRRMRTVAELKRLLRQKNIEGAAEQVIENVVERLKEQRYLNDTQYAALYSQTRRDGQKLGRQRVITDLKQRGVHADIIGKTMDETYGAVDEEKLARDFLAKKRVRKPASEKEAARIFRMLTRAGFRTGTTFKILKRWNVEDEVLSALESEDTDEPRD